MRKVIILFIIIFSIVLSANERSSREVLVEGSVLYNGNFTLYNPLVLVFDLSNRQIYPYVIELDGSFSFNLDVGNYYIYTFSTYTDNDNNSAYGIHPSCLYPEILNIVEGQTIDSLTLELIDYSPIYLTRFVEPITFGQTEVIPLEDFHMPLNCYEQHYLYADQDSIKIFGSKLIGYSWNGSIEEFIYEENAVWCPEQIEISDFWVTAFIDTESQPGVYPLYTDMEAIGEQNIQVNGVDEIAVITEAVDDYSELIKKWFVSDLGIVKEKHIRYYQDIPFLRVNLELYDFNIEGGTGMMPLDANNRWVYSLVYYTHPTDLISIDQVDSVILKWDPPWGEEPWERDEIDWLGYHIYEDDILFQTVDATQTEYLLNNPNGTHEYYVTAYNDDGDTEPTNTLTVNSTGINEQLICTNSKLYQNYPNPFNPETNISFSISEESEVDISIFNIKGQKIRTLTKTIFQKGEHFITWYGKDNFGKSISSGLYLYKLEVNGNLIETKKCVVLK